MNLREIKKNLKKKNDKIEKIMLSKEAKLPKARKAVRYCILLCEEDNGFVESNFPEILYMYAVEDPELTSNLFTYLRDELQQLFKKYTKENKRLLGDQLYFLASITDVIVRAYAICFPYHKITEILTSVALLGRLNHPSKP